MEQLTATNAGQSAGLNDEQHATTKKFANAAAPLPLKSVAGFPSPAASLPSITIVKSTPLQLPRQRSAVVMPSAITAVVIAELRPSPAAVGCC